MNRKMKRYYKDNSLLQKGKNSIFVYSGVGAWLEEVKTKRTEMTIEELAYICVKSNKGCFISMQDIQNEVLEFDSDDVTFNDYEQEFYENNECYCYCDLSIFGLQNGYLLITNLKTENVDLHS